MAIKEKIRGNIKVFSHRFRPQLMYFRPRFAFFITPSFIFWREERADSFLTGIIANNGHISANMASLDSPFQE